MPTSNDCSIQLRKAHAQAKEYADKLQQTVRMLKDSHFKLEMAYADTISRLAQAIEYKDEETGHHVLRISFFSAILANAIGLPKDQVLRIYNSASMHDLGKIGIPDAILLKPDKLTEAEFNIVKTHTTIGAKLLTNSNSHLLETGMRIALTHHERWNGTGYPNGLSGENIPIEGRIVCLVDVYDALKSERPYKHEFPQKKALRILRHGKGTHFDPKLVETFFDNLPRLSMVEDTLRSATTINEEQLFHTVLPDCDMRACFAVSKSPQQP
ncbi:MAG: HD domain-containing protein [Desulfovibrionales bacterium]|nr:HD domain-containing protein [Desulfovibrionales bacterium]